MVLEYTRSYALSASFLHGFLFPKYPDFAFKVKSTSYYYYKQWIYKPIIEHNQQEILSINKKKQTHREIHINLSSVERETIKSVSAYRELKVRPKKRLDERTE